MGKKKKNGPSFTRYCSITVLIKGLHDKMCSRIPMGHPPPPFLIPTISREHARGILPRRLSPYNPTPST